MASGLLLEVPRVPRGRLGRVEVPIEIYKRHVCVSKHVGHANCVVHARTLAGTHASPPAPGPALAASHQPRIVYCTGIMKATSG